MFSSSYFQITFEKMSAKVDMGSNATHGLEQRLTLLGESDVSRLYLKIGLRIEPSENSKHD